MAVSDIRGPLRPAGLRRWLRSRETRAVVLLVAFSVAILAAMWPRPDIVPIEALSVPLIIASLVLGPRTLPWFVVFQMLCLVQGVHSQHTADFHTRDVVSVICNFLLGLIVLLLSYRRSRLGVAGLRGESMFVDLRDRILNQGDLPVLPNGWYAEKAIASASGTPFAGDFVVTARPRPGRFEVALVDVSGKGEEAGTRALQLSGALAGLLGSVPSERFLPAANEFLLRQEWEEGFATAVHLAVDLVTGAFEIRTAGHPPALERVGTTGEWGLLDSAGPLLGLIEDAEFDPARGTIAPGDVLVLYTDGMVEEPRRDIDAGIDRLVEAAQEQLPQAIDGVARRLVDRIGSRDDDRCLVVVSRRAA